MESLGSPIKIGMSDKVRAYLSSFLFLLAVMFFAFMVYLIINGFPPEIVGHEIRIKNIRKPFLGFLGVFFAALLVHPDPRTNFSGLKNNFTKFGTKPYAIWILFGIYALLFTWQQITEYYALEINFIPFGYYDYMLHYLFQGRINYTGLLHGYYHLNNIIIFLAPFWYFVKSPWLLVMIYGTLAASAVFPLYGIAKERFQDFLAPFVIAFVYLNYRYLQNILLMNFSVEIFYPLFIFSALYAAMKKRWMMYYPFVVLGLLVKEDSFIYFSTLGTLIYFLPESRESVAFGRRRHGLATVLISLLYLVFLIKIFMPLTGNGILEGDLDNFKGQGSSMGNIFKNLGTDPVKILTVLFGSPAKWRTYFNLLSRLAFLPLFSPTVLFVLPAVFPLFLQGDVNFVDLRFQYAAAVIPFIFIAFIFGFSNLQGKIPQVWKPYFPWGSCLLLVVLNGGHYVTRRISQKHLQSIAWARSVPLEANLVTHGHLLPYVGYRKYNYYFAPHYERQQNQAYEAYRNADYYLMDLSVPLYPLQKSDIEYKIQAFKENPSYDLVRQEEDRYLFKRRES